MANDYTLEDTINLMFTSRAFATGIPTVLTSGTVSAYEDNSITQITAGITLGVDHDSVVGLNLVTIAATAANGFETGKDYNLVLTVGTVGGVSVVGETVGHFSLGRSAAAVSLATAQADLDIITGADGVILLSGTQASIDAIEADTNELQTVLSAGIAGEVNNETLIEQIKKIIAVVEHQRGAHTHQPIGNVFFVDPTNGDTHASGNRGGITDPYSLVQDCHDNAVTDSNHDMIILMSGAAAGPTTLTEDVTLSKRYLFIRGPGRDFLWTRSGSGDTITITADGIELAGFQVNTAATGSGNGITVTGADFFRAYRLWINDTRGDAIEITNGSNFVINECVLQGSGQSGSGHGIQIVAGGGQSGDYGSVSSCKLHDIAGDGIQLDTTGGGSVDSCVIEWCVFDSCTDDAIDIVDSNCIGTIIRDNRFVNNTTDIEDAGTNTVAINSEQWAKDSIATEARLAQLDAANLPTDVTDILGDTNELQTNKETG